MARLTAEQWFLALLLLVGFAIALFPEPPAKLLTAADEWQFRGEPSARVRASDFPLQYRHIPASIAQNPESVVFRTWTPTKGVVDLDLASPLFVPEGVVRIPVTGVTRTRDGSVNLFVECAASGERREVFLGSVNAGIYAPIVEFPDAWCKSGARVRLRTVDTQENVGVGSVFAVSRISQLKESALGRLPFFAVAAIVIGLLIWSGAALERRFGAGLHPLPAGFAALGMVALATFYFVSAIPTEVRWLGGVVWPVFVGISRLLAGGETWAASGRALRPSMGAWVGFAAFLFLFSSLVSNGLGHWEPNYRFWPAAWSSDNELPWMFAEAVRHGWDLKGLFGGGWVPTDRPPLMAAIHLLYGESFALMSLWNDGGYLVGPAYNAAAIVINALWVPVGVWLLSIFYPGIEDRSRWLVLLFVAMLPLSIFNTIYGWPKAVGAAYGLLAFGLVGGGSYSGRRVIPESAAALAVLLAALSILCHGSGALFLAPAVGLLLLTGVTCDGRRVVLGGGVAVCLLASWALYKWLTVPSFDPITKYALTGDYGFANPDLSLLDLLRNRYSGLSLERFLEIKWAMLKQLFVPVSNTVAEIGLNADLGATFIDRLRAWDFLLLARGNSPLVVAIVFALFAVVRLGLSGQRQRIGEDAGALSLIAVSIASWLLMVCFFLAPVVVHHLPQASLFGAALGAGGIMVVRQPGAFAVILVSLAAYVTSVWVVVPIGRGLSVDLSAAAILGAGGAIMALRRLTAGIGGGGNR